MLDAPLQLLFGVGLSTVAVNLRPSGDSRLDIVPARIERDAPFEFPIMRQGMRAWADEGHVALDHVEELRKLIDAPAAQPRPHLGDAWIAFLRLTDHRSILERSHGAELDDSERLLVEAVAVLQEEYR